MYFDDNLQPFTNYTYTLTVCTAAGCTTSDSASAVTLEDIPLGILAPEVTVITTPESSVVGVVWSEPTEPNGIIRGYSVLRRELGFYDTEANSVNCCTEYLMYLRNNSTLLSNSCAIITQVNAVITNVNDTNVDPYSFYQYCVIASNNVGSLGSDLSPPVRTDPAIMPLTGPELTATTINSTAVSLAWSLLAVSDLLGPLQGYVLYASDSGTEDLGSVLFSGLAQSFTATELEASTEYAFTVSIIEHL